MWIEIIMSSGLGVSIPLIMLQLNACDISNNDHFLRLLLFFLKRFV